MTRRVFAYESDPYRTELRVTVLEHGRDDDGPFVLVDDSILYPGGGGQPADEGTLEDVRIRSLEPANEAVLLRLDEPVAADSARLILDWATRFDRMQQHTAQHLISAVAADVFGWRTTAFHLGEDRCDVELDTPSISPDGLTRLEAEVMRHVREGAEVLARRISRDEYEQMDVRSRGLPTGFEGSVRLIEIAGVDVTTCGGTHVSSTSEIESICLLDTDSVRGGTRLYWVAGGRVRGRLKTHEKRVRALRGVLDASDDELVAAAEGRVEEAKRLGRTVRRLRAELAEEVGRRLAGSDRVLVEAHVEGVGPRDLQALARSVGEATGDRLLFLTATNAEGSFFLLRGWGTLAEQLDRTGHAVAQALGGRGGGSGGTFQGRAPSMDGRTRALEIVRQRAGGA